MNRVTPSSSSSCWICRVRGGCEMCSRAAARPMFDVDLAGRVLPFDTDAALAYPEIAAGRRQGGKPISQIDAQIAAIVRSRGARLATRNVRDFAECGITVVDPWGEA